MPATRRIPPRPGQFLYDTHVHTEEVSQCAAVPAKEVVRLHKAAGYAGIVITDHYNAWTFESFGVTTWARIVERYRVGYEMAREEGERVGLVVLPGLEVTLLTPGYSDLLVYGLELEFLYAYPYLCELDLLRLRTLIEPLGAYIVQAHPFRGGCTLGNPALLDAVEVYNGGNEASENGPAPEFARTNGLRATSGTDFHHAMSLGRGGMWLPERVEDAAGLVRVLRSDAELGLHETIP